MDSEEGAKLETGHYPKLSGGSDDPSIVDGRIDQLRTSRSVVVGLAEMAETRGDAVAIRDEFSGRSVTFADLDVTSDRVAARLLELGGAGDHRVALAVDDDADFMISAFGVLKAGMTQVPLDLQNPTDRLEYILDHARANLIISDDAALPRVEALVAGGRKALPVTDLLGSTDTPGKLAPPPPEAVARIMYTSGSTGRPKGVVHTHDYLATKMAADIEFFRFGPSDRVGGLFPLAFSASTAFSYGVLLAGATFLPYDVAGRGIHPLGDWINGAQITALAMVPTLFRRFINLLPPDARFDSVRLLMSGGELVLGSDVGLFQQRFRQDGYFVGQLAATECGPMARYVLRGSDSFTEAVVPAGFAPLRRSIRIVDEDGSEVPSGTVGEIVSLGGEITSWYWDDPERTTAVFGKDATGSRFYRTGDSGRIDEAGRLLHLGRLDGRVKVRGYGVDLREVEHALVGLDGVSEAVVSPMGQDVETTLVAHVTSSGSADVGQIRHDLGQRVPPYMVPAHFVLVDEFPLTPRGKINRQALPPPELGLVAGGERVEPQTTVEKTLLMIWEETLGVGDIGITDDFFALGGSSVQAFEVFARIAVELGRDLPPTTLLDYPTIQSLAKVVESKSIREVPTSLVPIRRQGSKTPLFVVHGGGGYVMWAQNIAARLDPGRPVIGIQPRPFDGKTQIMRLIEEMAASYLGEVRTVQPTGPYLICGYSFGGLVAYEMAQQLSRVGQETALLVLLDTIPFDTDAFAGPDGVTERVEMHRERMAGSGLKGRLSYFSALIGRRRKKLRRRWRSWRGTRNLRRGRAVPPEYRRSFFDEISSKARKTYVREPYPGLVTVITSAEKAVDHQKAWGELALGGLEVVELPVDHKWIVKGDRQVSLVTAEMNARLAEIDASMHGGRSSD